MKIVQWAIKTPKQISNIRESWKYLNELLLILREKAKALGIKGYTKMTKEELEEATKE